MSQQNVEVVRQAWEAWVRGDLPGLARLCDPEIIWDTSHFHHWPESGYHGLEEVEGFLHEWLAIWDEYAVDVEDVIAVPDGRVVSLVLQRGKGHGSGLAMEMEWALIATLRNGKLIRMDNYEDRAEALAALGL